MTLDLTSGFTGQSTSRVGAVLPGPYVQATGTPHVDVEQVEDIDVDVVEVPRLLVDSGAAKDPFELDILDFEVGRP